MSETIMGTIAACATIAAVLMFVLLYQLNKTLDEQFKLIKRMNDDWLDFVTTVIRAEGKK